MSLYVFEAISLLCWTWDMWKTLVIKVLNNVKLLQFRISRPWTTVHGRARHRCRPSVAPCNLCSLLSAYMTKCHDDCSAAWSCVNCWGNFKLQSASHK